jgi:hypothetical protein
MARRAIGTQSILRPLLASLDTEHQDAIRIGDTKTAAMISFQIEETKSQLLDIRYDIIEIGKAFIAAVPEIDKHLSLDQICDAMNINPVHRRSDDFRKYGTSVARIVMTLQLENSATESGGRFDYRIEDRPLVWCCQIAMFSAIETNPELGKMVHDEANRTFNGVFGEWREPTVLERCGVPLTMIQGSAP